MFREDKVCFYPQTIQNYLTTKWPETGPNPWFCQGGRANLSGPNCRCSKAEPCEPFTATNYLTAPEALGFSVPQHSREYVVWGASKEQSPVLWGRVVSLGGALLDHTSQQQRPFLGSWGGIMCQSCAELDQYPISTLQSHAQSPHFSTTN